MALFIYKVLFPKETRAVSAFGWSMKMGNHQNRIRNSFERLATFSSLANWADVTCSVTCVIFFTMLTRHESARGEGGHFKWRRNVKWSLWQFLAAWHNRITGVQFLCRNFIFFCLDQLVFPVYQLTLKTCDGFRLPVFSNPEPTISPVKENSV